MTPARYRLGCSSNRVNVTTEPNEWPWAISGQPGPFALGEFGQGVGKVGAVGDRAEVTAVAGAQAVPELVDGPQIDACGVEREAIAVIDAGVLTEPVQKDDGGAGIGRRPSAGNRPGPSGDR